MTSDHSFKTLDAQLKAKDKIHLRKLLRAFLFYMVRDLSFSTSVFSVFRNNMLFIFLGVLNKNTLKKSYLLNEVFRIPRHREGGWNGCETEGYTWNIQFLRTLSG